MLVNKLSKSNCRFNNFSVFRLNRLINLFLRMSKRNVAFIKPEEPNFLKRIKDEIGYKEPEDIMEKKVFFFLKLEGSGYRILI